MAQQNAQWPPNHYLPWLQGRVFLREFKPAPDQPNAVEHDFLRANEGIPTGQQLPQFLPRVNWPQPPYDFAGRQQIQRYDTDVRDIPNVPNLTKLQEIQRAESMDYPNGPHGRYLENMGPFRHADYRGKSWHEHVTHCHNILTDGLPSRQYLSDVELQSLLTIASYGLDDMVYIVNAEFCLDGTPRGGWHPSKPLPEFNGKRLAAGEVMHPTNFMTNLYTRQQVRAQITGRRWIVVPVMYNNNHWCMTMFDRQRSCLYIHDTMRDGRDRRITGICHLWARFWNRIGLPYHFHYFAPPTMEQPGGWECGYLGVAWVMHNLRNGVGDFVMGPHNVPNARRRDILIGDRDISFPEVQSEYLSNWQPKGYPDNRALDGVIHMISAVLCNELGISDHSSTRQVPRNRILRGIKGPGAYQRIKDIGKELKASLKEKPEAASDKGQKTSQEEKQEASEDEDAVLKPPTVEAEHFWTTTGGAQFSYGTADETVSGEPPEGQQGRRYAPDMSRRAPIEYRGDRLVRAPPNQITTWVNTEGCTASRPVWGIRRTSRIMRPPSHYGNLVNTEEALAGHRGTGNRAGKRKRAAIEDNGEAEQPQQPPQKKKARAKKVQRKKKDTEKTKKKKGGRKK